MALTNQPYLPLYVDDWMNNSKLKMCSPAAHGVMISIMCIMHKEVTYGKILLKQKFKQSDKQIKNFALQIAKLSTFDLLEIENPLTELVSEGVLMIYDDFLICKRMVRDAEISEKRSNAGKSGGTSNKSKNFAYTKSEANKEAKPLTNIKANSEANSVIENGVVNVIENGSVIENVATVEKPKRAKAEIQKVEVVFPFETEKFKVQWQLWKAYKSKEHNFKYKSVQSEQASLMELTNLSNGIEETAILVMNQSMAKGWKGFFELKNNYQYQNEKSNSNTGFKTVSQDFARQIAEGLQSK